MAKQNIKPRVRIPKKLKKGEVFEVKTLITHAMEPGVRKDKNTGKIIPRHIVNSLVVTYGGKTVLDAIWHPAVSANPYTAFYCKADASGPMEFIWTDDDGDTFKKTIQVNVTG